MELVPLGEVCILQIDLNLIIHLRIHILAAEARCQAHDPEGERSERNQAAKDT